MIEPTYPGVTGHYLNLGDCYDRKALSAERERMFETKSRYQACYVRAYQCLRAAEEVRRSEGNPLLTEAVREKMQKRVRGILSREVKAKKGLRGQATPRFLGGITCQGRVCLYETAAAQCKRLYELRDGLDLSWQFLTYLQEGILAAGYDVVACPSPENPTRLEHLLVPELSLGFVTTSTLQTMERRPDKRLQMETFVDKSIWKECKNRVRFARRIAEELTREGIGSLREAKSWHDQLEDLYHPLVNFAQVDAIASALTEEIRGL